MSVQSTATVNNFLTNYAQGLANDLAQTREIAEALAPTVTVAGAAGQYKKFSDVNSFQSYATERALGGPARRIVFSATDGSYNCKAHALECGVDDQERRLAGDSAIAQSLLDQAKVKSVLNGASLSHTKAVVDYVVANTTAVADRGNWTTATIDPIDQLDEQLVTLATNVGSRTGITLVIGLNAWSRLRGNDKVKKRCNGVQVSSVTPEQLVAGLVFPVRLIIGVLSYNTAAPGQTVSKSQVVGDHVIMTYSAPSPTQYDPSGFKTFTTGAGMVEAVRTYRDDSARSDIHAVDWSRDIQQTSTLSTIRIATS